MKLVRPAPDWRDLANCRRHGDVMFPDNSDERGLRDARNICAPCPVRVACLQDALDEEGAAHHSNRFGIRAGQNNRQRRRAHDEGLTAQQVLDAEQAAQIRAELTARDIYRQFTTPTSDGHLLWTGPTPRITVHGRDLTYGQFAFEIGHGRAPDRHVTRACDKPLCVLPAHLTDRVIRAALRAEKAGAAA